MDIEQIIGQTNFENIEDSDKLEEIQTLIENKIDYLESCLKFAIDKEQIHTEIETLNAKLITCSEIWKRKDEERNKIIEEDKKQKQRQRRKEREQEKAKRHAFMIECREERRQRQIKIDQLCEQDNQIANEIEEKETILNEKIQQLKHELGITQLEQARASLKQNIADLKKDTAGLCKHPQKEVDYLYDNRTSNNRKCKLCGYEWYEEYSSWWM
jgi:hypothetical protein